MKRVSVSLTPEAYEVYQLLLSYAQDAKQDKAILNAFLQKIELIKKTPHYGQAIAKNLIPIEYKRDYDLKNLFRVELPYFWRMLYTLMPNNAGVEIVIVVLDIVDHKQYDKLFGYKK
jgi:hypothetical protein